MFKIVNGGIKMKMNKENMIIDTNLIDMMLIKYNQAVNIILDEILTAIIDLNRLGQIDPDLEIKLKKSLNFINESQKLFKKFMEVTE